MASVPPEEDDLTTLNSGQKAVVAGSVGSIQVVYRHEEGREPFLDGAWRAFDVCTKNRVYGLDSRMRCVAVVDRKSGEPQPAHKLLGARLVGGRRRDTGFNVVSYPFPELGMAAVFEEVPGHTVPVETSPVTRVIVRQRVMRAASDGPPPTKGRPPDETGAGVF